MRLASDLIGALQRFSSGKDLWHSPAQARAKISACTYKWRDSLLRLVLPKSGKDVLFMSFTRLPYNNVSVIVLEVSLASRNVSSSLLPTLSSRNNGTLLEGPLGLPQEQMDSDTNVLLFSILYDTHLGMTVWCLYETTEWTKVHSDPHSSNFFSELSNKGTEKTYFRTTGQLNN